MYRLGWRNECAGIPRRPVLPIGNLTVKFIEQYLAKLTGVRALALPIYQKDLTPPLHFERIDENDVPTRFSRYLAFMKSRRRDY